MTVAAIAPAAVGNAHSQPSTPGNGSRKLSRPANWGRGLANALHAAVRCAELFAKRADNSSDGQPEEYGSALRSAGPEKGEGRPGIEECRAAPPGVRFRVEERDAGRGERSGDGEERRTGIAADGGSRLPQPCRKRTYDLYGGALPHRTGRSDRKPPLPGGAGGSIGLNTGDPCCMGRLHSVHFYPVFPGREEM